MKHRNLYEQQRWMWNACYHKRQEDANDWYISPQINKIRGWKRRVKRVQRWGENILEPSWMSWTRRDNYDVDHPGSYPYTDDSYKGSPWYGFYKHRQPPLWFFRIIIKQFVKAFEHWDKIFVEGKEPYDLMVEIFDPQYILSEIRCVQMQAQGDQYSYWPVSDEQKPFPFDKFGSKDCDLSIFDWELHVELDVVDDDFEYNGKDEATLLSSGYEKHIHPLGRAYFSKPIGDVWVGRKKTIPGK